MLPRRQFLRLAAASAALLAGPRIAFARAATERRFVFIIQRGAADGLNTVIPHGDPDYARLRESIAIDPAAATKLDGTFALHPSLRRLAGMYGEGQALFVHAVASPYRDRSHFDGQNVLETGGAGPYQVKDGWLNRLAGLLPGAGNDAIALAPTVPVGLRGPAQVTSYAPSGLPEAADDLLAQVGQLYAADSQLDALWSAAMEARGLAGETGRRQDAASIGRLAAAFLSRGDGPRIAMVETGGWDTHSQQNARLARQLAALDTMIGALRDGLGPVWNETVVLVATEFGRTAAVNGTGGTDHGTAAASMLLGGAVKGGRVIADWPGLASAALHEGRDLRPTIRLDALLAGAAAESLMLDPSLVARTLFPDLAGRRPLAGLINV